MLEIQELLDGGKLPTYIAESIDAVRNIENFAAHPLKKQVERGSRACRTR